jgi:hypothetical protein
MTRRLCRTHDTFMSFVGGTGHLVGWGEVLDGFAGVGEGAGDVVGGVDPQDLHRRIARVTEGVESVDLTGLVDATRGACPSAPSTEGCAPGSKRPRFTGAAPAADLSRVGLT